MSLHSGLGTIPRIENLTRRDLLTVTVAAALFIACGREDKPSASSGAESGFPRTVKHHIGETTISTRPERVVAVSDWYELDNLLAAGVKPVLYGYTDRYGTGVSPWAQAAGASDLTRFDLGTDIDFERLAGAAPDLIVAEWYRGERVYEQLSGIAPTIVLPKADADLTGWRLPQRATGQACGANEAAEEAIAATEAVLKKQAARLTGIKSRTVTIAYGIYGGANWFADSSDGPSGRLINDLGMELQAIGADDNAAISIEQLNLLNDSDLLLTYDGKTLAEWEANPLLRSVPAVRDGRYAVLSVEMMRAVFAPTTLSVRWAAPQLTDALLAVAENRGKRLT